VKTLAKERFKIKKNLTIPQIYRFRYENITLTFLALDHSFHITTVPLFIAKLAITLSGSIFTSFSHESIRRLSSLLPTVFVRNRDFIIFSLLKDLSGVALDGGIVTAILSTVKRVAKAEVIPHCYHKPKYS